MGFLAALPGIIGGLGGILGSKKQAKAADPWNQARAQQWMNTQALLEEMRANQYGTQTPWGTVSWQVDPNDPFKRTRRFDLSDRSKEYLGRKSDLNKTSFAKLMARMGATPTSREDVMASFEQPPASTAPPTAGGKTLAQTLAELERMRNMRSMR